MASARWQYVQRHLDVDTFPQDLVERVEVVTEGASAQYGSNAVGWCEGSTGTEAGPIGSNASWLFRCFCSLPALCRDHFRHADAIRPSSQKRRWKS